MRLMESLATTGPLADIFSDESVLQAMLDFEAALARVQARLKIIPEDAAKVISSCAETTGFDMSRLAQETLRLCSRGLARRKRLDRNGRDETRYLRPLEESIARGITPAEELLERFHAEWGGSVDPIFEEYAY